MEDIILDIGVVKRGKYTLPNTLAFAVNVVAFVVTQLEISFVEDLVFFDMLEHSQCTGALIKIIIICKQIAKIIFELFSRFVGKVEYINRVCIEGAAVKPGAFDKIRNGDILQLTALQQLYKGPLNFVLGVFSALIVFYVHKKIPH